MSIAWGDLKDQVREGILKDALPTDPADARWSETQLFYFLKWALDQFISHTAYEVTEQFTISDPATDLPVTLALPSYGDLYDEAIVVLTQNSRQEALHPMRLLPGDTWNWTTLVDNNRPRGYYARGEDTIYLTFKPEANAVLDVYYYTFYEMPSAEDDDTFEIQIPRWAELGIAYLIGAYASHPEGVQLSSIRQFSSRPDTGNPEDNPHHRQSEHFLKMYQGVLNAHHPQERVKSMRGR